MFSIHMLRPHTFVALALVFFLSVLSRTASLADDSAPPPSIAGEWVFSPEATAARAGGAKRANIGEHFKVREEADAVVFDWSDAKHSVVYRYKRDGSESEIKNDTSVTHHKGVWKGERFVIDTRLEVNEEGGQSITTVSQQVLSLEADALIVEFTITEPVKLKTTCVYQHPDAVATPAVPTVQARLETIAWLSGNWTGTLGSNSIEERWSPAGGGAMLATARTIAKGKMVSFEFLRIVERGGGLVYVAQPNGAQAVEFVLTSSAPNKIVFENPKHDFPQRISYALEGDLLTAEISDSAGGRKQTFTFKREAAK